MDPDVLPNPAASGAGGGSELPPAVCLPTGGDDGGESDSGAGGSSEAGAVTWVSPPADAPLGGADGGAGVGDGMGWFAAGTSALGAGLDDVRSSVESRARRLEGQQATPRFDWTSFQAYLEKAIIKPGGDMQLILGVPTNEKWEALKVTDSEGVMVQVTITTIRREDG